MARRLAAGDLAAVRELLDATGTLVIATGIVNMWQSDPHEVAASFARIESAHPGRFLLGVGAGHREATRQYARPYETLVGYVDALLADGVPGGSMVLAALGPKMLRLAADKTAGAHPYLVPVGYTVRPGSCSGLTRCSRPSTRPSWNRQEAARAIGRPRVRRPYLGLVNYTSNLRRLGWSEADLADPGSDALIDALVARGDPGQVGAQLTAHLTAAPITSASSC